ncbi:hypothetical protein KUA24_101 [Vibrio phage HNL01]|nr:hypothetical protein KUA24_101 [Vibrio phage HNL01]
MSSVNRSGSRNNKRPVGRQGVAKVGDYISLIEKLQQESDKFETELANNIDQLYNVMMDLAMGKISPSKDQVKAVEYMIARAEKILDEHYEDKQVPESAGKEEIEANAGKVQQSAQLISLVAKEA